MENSLMTFLKKFCFFCGFYMIGITAAYAAEYYVSPNGDAAWNSSTNINTPCAPATAMENAVAGDIVYFRGGTYALSHGSSSFWWYNGALNPSHSGTIGNPIVFMAYPGELPVMDVSTAESGWDNGVAFGVNCNNYITYDGFKIIADGGVKMGAIKIQGNNCPRVQGIVIRNCEFNGGSTIIGHTDNREGLRVEQTTGIVIENCTFYSFRQTNDWHNTSALKMYHNDNLTIKNCEVYNSSTGIYLKSDNDSSKVYNNWVHDCDRGIMIATFLTQSSDNVSIYNNVVANMASYGVTTDSEEQSTANNLFLYNNTAYNTAGVGLSSGKTTSGNGVEVYNNIFPSGSTAYTFVVGYTSDPVRGYIKGADHNQWSTNFKIRTRANAYNSYTDLSSWQSSGELEGGANPGVGSLSSNPVFTNSSGNMDQLDDFRLASNSPCKGAGRGGIDMGANIDLVGVQSEEGDNIIVTPQDKPSAVNGFVNIK